jgi:hypothetical protein
MTDQSFNWASKKKGMVQAVILGWLLILTGRIIADQISTQTFYGPDPKANAVREYIYIATRDFLLARGRDFIWTSGYRPATGATLASSAHAGGAIDYRAIDIPSAQRHAEGLALSKSLGQGFTVIVEETYVPGVTPGALLYVAPVHVMTFYCGGCPLEGRTKIISPKTGQNTHIHVGLSNGTTADQAVGHFGLSPTYGSFERFGQLTGPTFFGTIASPLALAQKLAAPPFNFSVEVQNSIQGAAAAGASSTGQSLLGGAGWFVPVPPASVGGSVPNLTLFPTP